VFYRQGYLSIDTRRSVRVRVAGPQATLTIKGKSEGAARDEFEYTIPIEDAEQLLCRLCLKPLIEKTRYTVIHAGHKWEIDEFHGENEGLLVAEIEIDDDSQLVAIPEWAGDEVTEDARYFNLNLVKRPYSTWPEAGKWPTI
jgi:adenylate cyclase